MRKSPAMLAWAMQIMFAKPTVSRLEPPFAIDLDSYDSADFESHIPSLKEVERRLMAVPADRRGMRWIHLPDIVLFYGERTFDVPYEDFVSKVDIGHVGQFYRDSLGVTTEVASGDDLGRTRRTRAYGSSHFRNRTTPPSWERSSWMCTSWRRSITARTGSGSGC